MAAVNFPDPNQTNPFEAPNGIVYEYIGTYPNGYWHAISGTSDTLDDRFVQVIGDNMTGALTLGPEGDAQTEINPCLLYTSPSPRD